MKRTPAKRSLSKIPLEAAHGGAGQRQMLFSNADPFVSKQFEAMTKGFLPAGRCYDWHAHENIDEFFLVESGTGTIEYADGQKFDYAGGDLFYSPAGLSHKLTNTGSDDNIFYFIRIAA